MPSKARHFFTHQFQLSKSPQTLVKNDSYSFFFILFVSTARCVPVILSILFLLQFCCQSCYRWSPVHGDFGSKFFCNFYNIPASSSLKMLNRFHSLYIITSIDDADVELLYMYFKFCRFLVRQKIQPFPWLIHYCLGIPYFNAILFYFTFFSSFDPSPINL